MRPLLYKEALAARPYAAVAVLYGLIGFLSYLSRSDVLSGLASTLTSNAGMGLLVTGAIVFAIGHAQIAPEVSLGHIEFLDGLPVGRFRIFAAKLAVGLASIVLLLGVQVAVELAFAQLAYDRQSLETLGTIMLAHAAGLLSFYCAGLLLSWLGGFGWILLGLGLVFVFTVAEFSETLRPLSLLHGYSAVRFEANVPRTEAWPPLVWATFGVSAALLSGLLFLGPGDALTKSGSRVVPRLRLLSIVGLSGLLAMATCGSLVQLGSASGGGPARLVQAGPFRVLTSAETSAVQDYLLERMPEIDVEVRRVLEVEDDPAPLDVELLGGGRYHAGVYTGGKIRMALTDDAAHIFAHELSHAYAHAIAGTPMGRHMDGMRFFNEGLAMWAAERAVPGSEASNDRFREWAGAIFQMGHHHLDPLMQDSLRGKDFDTFEAYPLGFAFVESLVESRGPSVVPCVLRQVAELPPEKIVGPAIWSYVLHRCEVDLPAVMRAYEQRLSGYAERWPSPARAGSGRPERTDAGDYVMLSPAPPWPLGEVERVCRFRSRPEAKVADLQEAEVRGDRCRIPLSDNTTDTVSFQIGVRLSLGWVAYGPWLSRPTPR